MNLERLYQDLQAISTGSKMPQLPDPALESTLSTIGELGDIPHCLLGMLEGAQAFLPPLAAHTLAVPQPGCLAVWLSPPKQMFPEGWLVCPLPRLLSKIERSEIDRVVLNLSGDRFLTLDGDLLNKMVALAAAHAARSDSDETLSVSAGAEIVLSQPENEIAPAFLDKIGETLGSDPRIEQAFLFTMYQGSLSGNLTLGLVPAAGGERLVDFLPLFHAIFADWDGGEELFTQVDLVLLDDPDFRDVVASTVSPLDLCRS